LTMPRTVTDRRLRMAHVAIVCAISAACATRGPASTPPQVPAPAPAVNVEQLVERGCYRCLEEAFATTSASGATEAAFQAAILLTLRSKELGLPFAHWLERARAVLPGDSAWSEYLAIAESAPQDPLSTDRDAILGVRRRTRDQIDAARRALTSGPGSAAFRSYLDLSIVCGPAFVDDRDAAVTDVLRRFGAVPLLQYRAGLCGHTSLLTDVLRQDADFADVYLELGRAALQRERPDYEEALTRLRQAQAAFPASATIVATIGTVALQREEWAEALAAFEATLTLVPSHRDALLGAAISLSHLNRHEEALAPASRLLELGSWFISDAHYWRAWNEYRLGRIAEARADIDRARALSRNAPTLVLSGIISWREGRLAAADAEFTDALNLDFGQCEAASYLGGVRAEQQRWQESLAAFQHAAQCFELAVLTRRKAVADLTASTESASAVARQVASHERAIAEADVRRVEAITNIASIERRIAIPYTGGEAAPAAPSP
jgi:tetratricopeptide (TPR) repeat protein